MVMLGEAVASLLSARTWRWSNEDVADVLHGLREVEGQLVAARGRAITEAQSRGFAASQRANDLASWMRDQMQLAPGDARKRIRLAQELGAGPFRAVEAALAQGRIGPEQAEVILQALHALPPEASEAERVNAEKYLLVYARQMDRFQLRQLGCQIREQLTTVDRSPGGDDPDEDSRTGDRPRRGKSRRADPDDDGGDAKGGSGGTESSGDSNSTGRLDPQAVRSLTFSDTAQGTTMIQGELDAESAALLRTALDTLSAPLPAQDGTRDSRSPTRRRADALVELVRRALSSDVVPSAGGTRPHLMVVIPWNTLINDGSEPAMTNWGLPLSRATLRRIACDAVVSRIVLDPNGVPLDVGRAKRIVPPHIRRSLIIRDRGCCFPNCDRPPSWTDAHHIRPWLDGGETKLDNTVLLCGQHHHQVHQEDWKIVVSGDRRPTFVPPRHVDPLQRPRRNPYSQPPPDLFNGIFR